MRNDWVDEYIDKKIVNRKIAHNGRIWDVVHDTFELGPYEIERDYVRHMGAVAVLAVNKHKELLTIRQYRQPVGAYLIEIPAGLLDNVDEDPIVAAQRELMEEANCTASRWSVLADFFTSPGSTSEAVRIYLAEDVSELDMKITELDDEESEIEKYWVSIDDALDRIEAGQWQSPTLMVGIMAYARLKNRRSVDSQWPARTHLLETDRVHRFSKP